MDRFGDFEFTPPRHVWYRSASHLGMEETSLFLGRTAEVVGDQPFFFLTIDLTEFKGDTPESRRYASEMFRKLPPRAVAIIADKFVQRNLAKLLFKAISILPGGWRQHTAFFKTGDPIEPWFQSMIGKLEVAAERIKREGGS